MPLRVTLSVAPLSTCRPATVSCKSVSVRTVVSSRRAASNGVAARAKLSHPVEAPTVAEERPGLLGGGPSERCAGGRRPAGDGSEDSPFGQRETIDGSTGTHGSADRTPQRQTAAHSTDVRRSHRVRKGRSHESRATLGRREQATMQSWSGRRSPAAVQAVRHRGRRGHRSERCRRARRCRPT